MAWNKVSLDQRGRETPPPRPRRGGPVSPALVRFCATVGGAAAAVAVIHFGGRRLGVGGDLFDLAGWDLKIILLVVIALVIGLIGTLAGMGIGMSVPVRSRGADNAIGVLWHCAANGLIISLFLWSLVLHKEHGADRLRGLIASYGRWPLTLHTVLFDGAACLAIALVWLLSGTMRPGRRPVWIAAFLLALPIACGAGYVQAGLLGTRHEHWILKSALLAFLLVPAVAYMLQRDREQREQLQRALEGG